MLDYIKQLIGNMVQAKVDLQPDVNDIVALRSADGTMRVEDLRKYRNAPRAVTERSGSVTLVSLKDYIAYVKAHSEEGATMFVNPQRRGGHFSIGTTILDYHINASSAGRQQNKAALMLQAHPFYSMVLAFGEWQSQSDFAKAVRIASQLFVDPEPHDMLTIATELKITSKATHVTQLDDSSGSINMLFNVQNTAVLGGGTAERTLKIPEYVQMLVPVLLDSAPVDIRLRFEFCAPESPGQQARMRLVYDDQVIEEFNMINLIEQELRAAGINCVRGQAS